jgi:uncharacterized damage-inducible protein DinB
MGTRGQQLADQVLAHRTVTVDLAGRIPDDRVDFRPWPGAMTLGGLLQHMAAAHHMFVAVARGEAPTRPDPASLPSDLPGIRRLLAAWTEEDAAAIRDLDDAQLATPRAGIRNMTLTAATWLHSARDHEIHHKGQLFVYARMVGVEPPFFVRRPGT